ncbi:MAG: nitroreductase family protein [Cardiobacteriaceae bacterium]|nr:nitroreductase family protein [Cardiobacteriaceae bacterium]
MNTNLSLLDAIHTRRSVKQFDPEHRISRDTLREIIRHTISAPSSINLQPWRFVILDSPESKAKLSALVKTNTRQLETCSAMIAVIGDNHHLHYDHHILNQSLQEGHMPADVAEHYLAHIDHYRQTLSPAQIQNRSLIDASLAAMQLMLIAKAYGYDTNAIGGFEREQTLKALCLDPSRYVAVMLIAIGKAAKAGRSSSRMSLDYVLSFDDGLGLAQP